MKYLNKKFVFHIGFHKTASTFFQKKIYKNESKINFLNRSSNDKEFSLLLETNRWSCIKKYIDDDYNINKINLICEENISGHMLSNKHSLKNLKGLKKYFPDAKIIICIREQKSMINSIYSNYILNGGFKNEREFIDYNLNIKHNLFNKTCYFDLINKYIEYFGKKNVHVFLYEEFSKYPNRAINSLYKFIGIKKSKKLKNNILNQKINKSPSRFILSIIRFTNKRNLNFNLFIRLLRKISVNSNTNLSSNLPAKVIDKWSKDNKKISKLINTELKNYGYK